MTYLLYRGSDHGWKPKDFHFRCDNKGSLICLFKVKRGDCIGGFSTAEWSSTTTHANDCEAMLFNLSSCRHFPSKN